MTQTTIEYFGGPEDGRRVLLPRLGTGIDLRPLGVTHESRIQVTGGEYRPERLPDGTWRLHFFDTVVR